MDYQKYNRICKRYCIYELKSWPKLNLEQITGFEEPTRKLLYAYYGYISLLDNYTDLELSKNLEANNLSCLYEIAIHTNNLKLIKYLKSRNIIYDYPLWSDRNLYYSAIYYGCLKIIKYFDSNNFIFNNGLHYYLEKISYLEAAAWSGFLKIVKYFESKEKDSPDFREKIIKCYINAIYSYKKSICIITYLETKYPLYITNKIIYILKKDLYQSDRITEDYYQISGYNIKNTVNPIINYLIRYKTTYLLCYI
jgi:hypothetical protein